MYTPTPIKFKDGEKAKLETLLYQQITQSRQNMSKLLDNVIEYDRFYNNDLPEKDFPWEGCSNVNVPITAAHVDTYHSHINDVILGVRPLVKIQPPPFAASVPEMKEAAQRVEQALEYVMHTQMKVATALDPVFLYALRHPASVVKLAYREDYRTVQQPVEYMDETGEIKTRYESVQVPKYKGPKIEHVDINNFVIYPLTAKDIESASIVGDRFRITPDELKRKIKAGVYNKSWAAEITGSPQSESTTTQDTNDDEVNELLGIERLHFEEFWLWEVIAPYDADGDGIAEDCCFTLDADTGTIIKATTYPYAHGRRYYVGYSPYVDSRRFFKRCVPQLLEGMQRELNTIHNQRTDATTIALCKAWKRKKGSELEPDNLQLHPGAVFDVNDQDDLQELPISPVIPGIDIESVNKDYAERASAVNDVSLGRASEGDKTAQEVSIVSAKSGVRFNDVVRRLQESNVLMVQQVIGLMDQFMTDEELALIGGGLTKQELAVPWEIIPHGNQGTADKVQKQQQAVALYDKLMQNPLVMSNPLRVYALTELMLQAFEVGDYENFIGTEEELQQQIQQAQQQEMMQQQQEQEMMQQQAMMSQDQAQQQMMMQQGDKQDERAFKMQLEAMRQQGRGRQ